MSTSHQHLLVTMLGPEFAVETFGTLLDTASSGGPRLNLTLMEAGSRWRFTGQKPNFDKTQTMAFADVRRRSTTVIHQTNATWQLTVPTHALEDLGNIMRWYPRSRFEIQTEECKR